MVPSKNKNSRLFGLVFTYLLFITLPAMGQSAEDELSAAYQEKIGTLNFSSYFQDLGLVKQGTILEFRFPYQEMNDAAVQILGIHEECGCMSQSLAAGQVILGKAKGVLVIKADTSHFTGNFDKQVMILSNEERDRPHVFRLRAKIEKQLVVYPPIVEITKASRALDKNEFRIKLRSLGPEKFDIEQLIYDEKNFLVDYYPVESAWELYVRWKADPTPGSMNETIEVLTNGTVKSFKIPVMGARAHLAPTKISPPR